MSLFKRASGILLHPTSLPGPDGIGDLGPEAYRWVNFLAESGCSLWQILPLGPTGFGDSPYQCFSAFAGNPYLVSPALLLDEGLLTSEDLADRPEFPASRVDYGPVIQWKLTLLDRAYVRFKRSTSQKRKAAFEAFKEEQRAWLLDFSLFMAIKEAHGGASWDYWPEPLRKRDPEALNAFHRAHEVDVERHSFRQFLFFRQWQALRQYAHEKGVQIIGDVPIFVAYDSADVWSHPDLFYLDETGKPTVVAGVPPDYFSATGQLWGNPLYRWDYHRETGFAWWLERLKATFAMVDIVRLDHFRGFAGYWEVPYGMPTAEKGRWVPGPGIALFEAIRNALGGLPIIAEDLGEITPDVIELREQLGLPGMKIFQFAFASDADDPFLPHNYVQNCVAYTGTHDNDTAIGWYNSAPEKERDFVRRYLARSGEDIAWDMIRAVWSSVAMFAIAPLQDFLKLGPEARMNYPGRPAGNWGWRYEAFMLDDGLKNRIKEINYLYGRLPEHMKPPKVVKKWT
ncbi:4-alpha-glucanotransferase [Anaerolinea thermophila UNI-1]|uniref:4-alpha-glucanotransferase n=2 Tax=Anaerolinea thermophila TaxID=167964 RepID=E8MXP8_ANATU|nr:4-alpha-glucanotransferase [Anaerolinea thermophila UNI-1]